MTTLSREEIEGLKEYAKRIAPPWSVSTFNDRHIVSGEGGVMVDVWWTHARGLIVAAVNALPALLAEIEAGRAGAERVQALEALIDKQQAALSDVEERADKAEAELAALRQAAQPVDGVWPRILTTAEAAPEHLDDDQATAWVDGWNACVKATPAAPAQVGAQPAGRVEWPIEARRLFDAAQQMTIAIDMGWDLDGVIEGLRDQVAATERLGVQPSQDHYASPAPSGDGEGGGDG